MNQIIDKPRKKVFLIEISNAVAEIPFEESTFSNNLSSFFLLKQYLKKNKYRLQFFISVIIATFFLIAFSFHLYKTNEQEKLSKELLNNYTLTTLYQTKDLKDSQKTPLFVQNPFVIGMIKISKLDLNYPILSKSNDELLKISLCRFAGPMPNEVGNLCIAGHNYIDNTFFSNLSELEKNDLIEIYDLTGNHIVYSVFAKYEVASDDLSCTSQEQKEKKIVTLLTCNNINGKRTVVQALEK